MSRIRRLPHISKTDGSFDAYNYQWQFVRGRNPEITFATALASTSNTAIYTATKRNNPDIKANFIPPYPYAIHSIDTTINFNLEWDVILLPDIKELVWVTEKTPATVWAYTKLNDIEKIYDFTCWYKRSVVGLNPTYTSPRTDVEYFDITWTKLTSFVANIIFNKTATNVFAYNSTSNTLTIKADSLKSTSKYNDIEATGNITFTNGATVEWFYTDATKSVLELTNIKDNSTVRVLQTVSGTTTEIEETNATADIASKFVVFDKTATEISVQIEYKWAYKKIDRTVAQIRSTQIDCSDITVWDKLASATDANYTSAKAKATITIVSNVIRISKKVGSSALTQFDLALLLSDFVRWQDGYNITDLISSSWDNIEFKKNIATTGTNMMDLQWWNLITIPSGQSWNLATIAWIITSSPLQSGTKVVCNFTIDTASNLYVADWTTKIDYSQNITSKTLVLDLNKTYKYTICKKWYDVVLWSIDTTNGWVNTAITMTRVAFIDLTTNISTYMSGIAVALVSNKYNMTFNKWMELTIQLLQSIMSEIQLEEVSMRALTLAGQSIFIEQTQIKVTKANAFLLIDDALPLADKVIFSGYVDIADAKALDSSYDINPVNVWSWNGKWKICGFCQRIKQINLRLEISNQQFLNQMIGVHFYEKQIEI